MKNRKKERLQLSLKLLEELLLECPDEERKKEIAKAIEFTKEAIKNNEKTN